jgi:ATP-binding cassette, subfamily B, bacterial PglK
MRTAIKIFDLFTHEDRKEAVGLFVLILLMALFDLIGVASIFPFITVLTNPSLIETNSILSTMYAWLDTDVNTFLIILGGQLLFLYLLSLAVKAITTYVQLHFVLLSEYKLSKRLIEGYLNQPYEWFMSRNTVDLGKSLLIEVGTVVNQGIMPLVILVAQSIVTFALLALLLFVSPGLAMSVFIVLGLVYALILKYLSRYLSRIGKDRSDASELVFKVVSEVFEAVKVVKIFGVEREYINRFSAPAMQYAKQMASAATAAQMPKFILEAIAFGGLMVVMLYLMVEKGDITKILPVISLYALAGYRLMPALQLIYSSITQLRFVGSALDNLHGDIKNLKSENYQNFYSDKLNFDKSIELSNITYRYPESKKNSLSKINMRIPAGSRTAFVGYSGGGKTTLVDVILGLLEPQIGLLKVDGVIINSNNLRQWQKNIGYVPQDIYLSDDTVMANIAFGVRSDEIDEGAVFRAAKKADLHDFVTGELEQGYYTSVGERGIRLSGGQRQRIGIARALYHNPALLILDEATSALDNLTERSVMEAIAELGQDVTVILIAHRLSTVRACDQIFLINQGQIYEKGSYDELIEVSAEFRAMAKIDNIDGDECK